jgi:ABC-type bacteriocin/lantibiotic exporter with double-glycine peptidase domain
MTLVLSLFLGVKVYVVLQLFTKHIARTGKQTQRWSVVSNKIFHEAHGNFKLLKLLGRYEEVYNRFASATQQYASAQIMYQTLQGIPRFIIETMGFMLMIGMLLYVTYRYGSAEFVLPLVSL